MAQALSTFQTTLWNSPDQLSTVLKWLFVAGVLSAATIGSAMYFVSDRISTLMTAQLAGREQDVRNQKSVSDNQSIIIKRQEEALTRLDDDLKAERLKSAELVLKREADRVVSDNLDYGGVHHLSAGDGTQRMSVGSEQAVFETIQRLYALKDWVQLRLICESEIKVTPQWLTPYMFSGVASANLHDYPSAIDRLQHVVAEAGEDPHYSDAPRLLADVKAAQSKAQTKPQAKPQPQVHHK
jgi:uncharacterized membrane protein YciS (DUF1049 family)